MTVIPSADDPLLSVSKVAQIFDVKPYTVRDWIKHEKLKAVKIQGRLKVQHSEVVRFANSRYGPTER